MALPNVGWQAAGMVTVAELLRRLSPVPADAGAARDAIVLDPQVDPEFGANVEPQLPIETLLRREGRQTGAIPTQRSPSEARSAPPFTPPSQKPPSRRALGKVAVAAGAAAAAGSVVTGGLLLSQPSDAQHPVVGSEQGSYPGQGASEALPPADSLLGTDPFHAPGSAFSAAFPNSGTPGAPGAATIPATGAGAVTPAGSNGAPSPAVPPAAGDGAPPAASSGDNGGGAERGGTQGGGDEDRAGQGGANSGGQSNGQSSGGGSGLVGTVTGTVDSLLGTAGGLL